MGKQYTIERSHQIVLSVLKANGIKKVVTSPGSTNITLVASMMNDPWFEMYSSVDERSAAYIACGLAAESGEPIVLSCTGATASRNYFPGLTEAYYRQLPVLAITSAQHSSRIGQYIPQVLDRSVCPKDLVKLSVDIPSIYNKQDEWNAIVKINKAVLELRHRGCGPVHINLATDYKRNFSVKELPPVRIISRIMLYGEFPELPKGRIGVYSGAHVPWNKELTNVVDRFCSQYDAVVFCDHTSNYSGKYRVQGAIVGTQSCRDKSVFNTDLVIHIGNVSADYAFMCAGQRAKQVWRVNEDGEIRDTFKKLTKVFEMPEIEFFKHYIDLESNVCKNNFLNECKKVISEVRSRIDDDMIPFSNPWMAKQLSTKLPKGSILHLSILNTIRSWSLFESTQCVSVFCNTGGFGIDGSLSSFLGGALAQPEKLHILVIGDLAFFYDMNALGNRHFPKNTRILLINNGNGTEFKIYTNPGFQWGDDTDKFISAGKHYGNKSRKLVRHFSEDLGFEYISASNKNEFLSYIDKFTSSIKKEKPIFFETFTNDRDENDAQKYMNTLAEVGIMKAKSIVRDILGETGVEIVKKVLRM